MREVSQVSIRNTRATHKDIDLTPLLKTVKAQRLIKYEGPMRILWMQLSM